jgi:hypothetical protein
MNSIKVFLAGLVAMAAFYACSSDHDDDTVVPSVTTTVDTVHVAVVLPKSIQKDWQNSIDFAMTNIAKAQRLEQHQVTLKLHYYDEDTEDLDRLAYRLVIPQAGDDSISAIVGSSNSTSTTNIWEQAKRYQQQFDEDLIVDHKLPQAKNNWAVVISPSTTWANYRHQADAFAMYQTLRKHGYDEDHIVLIVEDNLYIKKLIYGNQKITDCCHARMERGGFIPNSSGHCLRVPGRSA